MDLYNDANFETFSNVCHQQEMQQVRRSDYYNQSRFPSADKDWKCSAMQTALDSRFAPEFVSDRLIDIINQCRYIASKTGLDKRSLIQSIKDDEMGEKVRRMSQHAPWCSSLQQKPQQVNKEESVEESEWANVDQMSTVVSGLNPISEFDADQHFIINRPPTRRSPIPPKKSVVESLMDDTTFEGSDESDFDPSETSEMLENIMKPLQFQETTTSTNSIPPNRKPALLDLKKFYEKCSKSDENVNSTDDDDNDMDKVLIKVARARACASFVQIREKLSNPSLFGDFDDGLLTERELLSLK